MATRASSRTASSSRSRTSPRSAAGRPTRTCRPSARRPAPSWATASSHRWLSSSAGSSLASLRRMTPVATPRQQSCRGRRQQRRRRRSARTRRRGSRFESPRRGHRCAKSGRTPRTRSSASKCNGFCVPPTRRCLTHMITRWRAAPIRRFCGWMLPCMIPRCTAWPCTPCSCGGASASALRCYCVNGSSRTGLCAISPTRSGRRRRSAHRRTAATPRRCSARGRGRGRTPTTSRPTAAPSHSGGSPGAPCTSSTAMSASVTLVLLVLSRRSRRFASRTPPASSRAATRCRSTPTATPTACSLIFALGFILRWIHFHKRRWFPTVRQFGTSGTRCSSTWPRSTRSAASSPAPGTRARTRSYPQCTASCAPPTSGRGSPRASRTRSGRCSTLPSPASTTRSPSGSSGWRASTPRSSCSAASASRRSARPTSASTSRAFLCIRSSGTTSCYKILASPHGGAGPDRRLRSGRSTSAGATVRIAPGPTAVTLGSRWASSWRRRSRVR